MKCWKCGAELPEGQRFCGGCGAEQRTGQETPPPAGEENPGSMGQAGANREIVLKVFAAVCAMVYGGKALRYVFSVLENLVWMLDDYFYFSYLIVFRWILLSAVLALAGVWMCAVLLLTAFKRTEKNADPLLVCLGGGAAVILAARLLEAVFQIGSSYAFGQAIAAFALSLLGAVVTVGGVYAIRRFLLGEEPLAGKNAEDIRREFAESFAELRSSSGTSARTDRNVREAQAAYEGGAVRMKTDRSLVAYILLSIITCGIYSYYFLYAMARDANVICSADGKKTGGLLAFILLSFITCGFYALYWYYALGNRLAENAPRYGMSFQENGTTVLLWYLVGALACGIGPFVAMHILIKNMNSLSVAYNMKHGF